MTRRGGHGPGFAKPGQEPAALVMSASTPAIVAETQARSHGDLAH